MSTYYYFWCEACQESSTGNFTRQAWGAGNADLVDVFKFVMLHVLECGEEHIRVISEHDSRSDLPTAEEREKFIRRTTGIFPRSEDWSLTGESNVAAEEEWMARELGELHPK